MLSSGVRYMIIAAGFYAVMNVCVKMVPHLPALEVVFFRALITLGLSYAYLRKAKIHPWGNNKKYLILRGLAGMVGLTLYIYTVQRIPLATAVTVQYVSPIFTSILAIFILGERTKKFQWFFFLLSFAGVLIMKGFDSRVPVELLLIGITSAFFSGLAYNFVRKLKGVDHPMVVVFYFPFITLPVVAPYTLTHWVAPQGWDWLFLLGIGVATQIAQYYMTKSFQTNDHVADVSIFQYLGVVYALIIGLFFFDERFSWISIMGMTLVVGAMIMSMLYKSGRIKIGRS